MIPIIHADTPKMTALGGIGGISVGTVARMRRWIHVEFVKEGVHCYPAAASDPKLKTGDWDDVSFLASPHMHYFYFKVVVEVFHNDRDLEFIQFSRWCQRLYEQGTMQINSKSCEMLAEELIRQISARYPGRDMKVSVLEDNINGATIEYMVEK